MSSRRPSTQSVVGVATVVVFVVGTYYIALTRRTSSSRKGRKEDDCNDSEFPENSNQSVLISNLDRVQWTSACSCHMSFSEDLEKVEFFLPQMAVFCTCGKTKRLECNDEDMLDLKNILRPWQVAFLESEEITRAFQLLKGDRAYLAKKMKKWRLKHKVGMAKKEACSIALHIWCKHCTDVVKQRLSSFSLSRKRGSNSGSVSTMNSFQTAETQLTSSSSTGSI